MDFIKNKDETHVFALGGLYEVGKNTYIIEHDDEIIIIDAGMKLSDDMISGVDAIVAEYTYLKENEHKIKGLLITHGHEDHIGGIPYLLGYVNIPIIWAPKTAIALIKRKMDDRAPHIKYNIEEFGRGGVFKTDNISVSVFEVNHSIPDSYGMIIKTPAGVVMTTGDFKFDLNPLGEDSQMDLISAQGVEGVDLLLSDSTGALSEGWTPSESIVAKTIDNIFLKAKGRVLIATFASNIYRVKQIVESGANAKKKILVFGRSMEKGIDVAREAGIITVPDNVFIAKGDANKYPDKDILIISTGSQGEQLAALSRIANGSHQQISVKTNDTIVFSSSPIPGNRASVAHIVNTLYKQGATVLENSMISGLHTSGHAAKEEQRLMLKLAKPKHFLPIHGEYSMLNMHIKTAIETGVKKENTYLLDNGDVLSFNKAKEFRVQRKVVPAKAIYIDGDSIKSGNSQAVFERKHMGEEGIISIFLTIDSETKRLVSHPSVLARGTFYADTSKDLVFKIRNDTKKYAYEAFKGNNYLESINKLLNANIGRLIKDTIHKQPIIEAVVVDVAQKPTFGPEAFATDEHNNQNKQPKK